MLECNVYNPTFLVVSIFVDVWSLGVSCTVYTQCYRILLLKYGAVEINLHLFIYFVTLQSSVTNPNSRGMKCVKKQGSVSIRGTAPCPGPVLSSGGWR